VAIYRKIMIGALVALAALNIAVLWIYVDESRQLDALADQVAGSATSDSEKMRGVMKHIVETVPNRSDDRYFLLPVFRPLRPTALQVLEGGGSCAYKARAFIVLLRHLDVNASKFALYDGDKPVHAVAVAKTERGDYVVDLLYGVIYQHEDGSPIPLATLEQEPILVRQVLEREAAGGNPHVQYYPRDRYVYENVKSINWHKNAATSAVYSVLTSLSSEEAIDRAPRPYLSEQPALMVFVLSGICAAMLLAVPLVVRAGKNLRRRLGKGRERDVSDRVQES